MKKRGVKFEDRVQSARTRAKGLNAIERVLDDKDISKWSDYKKQLLLRLAPSILPRINQFENDDGEPFEIVVKLRDAKGNGVAPKAV
jgi:hypothetical protein